MLNLTSFMEWVPNLLKQRSCSTRIPADVFTWSRSCRRSTGFCRKDDEEEEALRSPNFITSTTRSRWPRWRLLWRRMRRHKGKIFDSSASTRVPYDPYTYSQNFDQGSSWQEPDNLSRSFSARFADPSRIFQRERY